MKKHTRKKNTRKKDTSKRELNYHLDKIAWVIDPDAGPEDLLKFLLARFKETGDVWTVYEIMSLEKVKSTKNPFRYYYYLFILSVLAYQQLQKDNRKRSATSKEPLVQFPIYAKDPVYGRLVKYYYGLKSKEKKGEARRYLAIPTMLRDGTRAMFEPESEGESAKKSKIKLIDGFTTESFHFWNVEGFPVDMFSDQPPKEVDIEKLNFPKTQADIDVINDSIYQFRFSKRWVEWEKGRKVKGIAKENSYLEPIEDILGLSNKGLFKKPVWFRPSGPLAIDFQHHRVHINKKKVTALKEHVLNHQISMLESPAATGKTVLVRSLAFEPYEDKNLEIFYFDCDSERGFSPTELAGEIESAEGLFIIENIHSTIMKLKPFFLKLQSRSLTNRHILFTSRLPIQKRAYLSPDDLEEIHFFPQLDPFYDADNIIDLYISHELEHPLSLEKRKRIKELTWGNYKWLGYMLQEYAEKKGKGHLEEWLEEGVKLELEYLEYGIEDLAGSNRSNPEFPEIVVALAPLYMNEVLTAKKFLTKELHFKVQNLSILVERGEITCQKTKSGDVFYGLPYSSLAKAYWDYGQEYWKRRGLGTYEAFVFDYVRSCMPNGLEALAHTRAELANRVSSQLLKEHHLPNFITAERSGIGTLVWILNLASQESVKGDVIASLAEGLRTHEKPFLSVLYKSIICTRNQELACKLCCFFLNRQWADRITNVEQGHLVPLELQNFAMVSQPAARQFCSFLDPEQLAQKFCQRETVQNIAEDLSQISLQDSEIATQVWKRLSEATLQHQLTQTDDIVSVSDFLAATFEYKYESKGDFWKLMKAEELAQKLIEATSVSSIGEAIGHLVKANPKAADQLWGCLDLRKLAAKAIQAEKRELMECGWYISVDRQKGREFADYLSEHEYEPGWHYDPEIDDEEIPVFMCNYHVYASFYGYADEDEMLADWACPENFQRALLAISRILAEGSSVYLTTLLDALEIDHLVSSIKRTNNLQDWANYLLVLGIHKWELLGEIISHLANEDSGTG